MSSAWIETRTGKKGTTYRVRVRATRVGCDPKNLSKTFHSKAEAMRYKKELQNNASTFPIGKRVSDIIQAYLDHEDVKRTISSKKASNLKLILKYDISDVNISSLEFEQLKAHCVQRKEENEKISPSTLYQDITNLLSSLRDANAILNLKLNLDYLSDCKRMLTKFGFIHRSQERNRIPTSSESKSIINELTNNKKLSHLLDIVILDVETCLRRGEIFNLKWSDYNRKSKTLLIRDRKHPRKKHGNNTTINLSKNMINLIESQVRGSDDDYIFPYKPDTVSSQWRKLMKQLGIQNLQLRDLRAYGITNLVRKGKTVSQIAQISGHRKYDILQNHYNRSEATLVNDEFYQDGLFEQLFTIKFCA